MSSSNSSRTWLIAAVVLVALVVCCVCLASSVVCLSGFYFAREQRPSPFPTRDVNAPFTPGPPVTPQLATPAPADVQAPPGLWRDAVPPEAAETLHLIESSDTPQRDLLDVTLRLKDPGVPIPQVVREEPWNFEVGDTHEFWVSNEDTNENFQIMARLVYKTPHTYFFVDQDARLDERDLKRVAERFETQTYPTNREFFGSEWTPGVDSDPHLTVLFARGLGSYVAGYYNSMDEFSRLVHEYSNEMEMFYINADGVDLDDPFYECVLAHEFQHMIHWSNDRNESNWINEGFSELACLLNGLDAGGSEYSFGARPDTQLNSWADETGDAGPNYGASYLFMAYFLDRFGEEATRALVAHQENSMASVDEVLKDLGTGLSFDDVFADWVVANYLNDPTMADGRYGYLSLVPPSFETDTTYRERDLPAEQQTTVSQYGTDYVVLRGKGDFQLDFAGASLVGLASISAHSGQYLWWAGRENNSDTTLTREFDLSGLSKATLTFWTWYDIEEDWDYAYVQLSTDGKHWTTLPGQTTTNTDPNGSNYGNGYTGASGGWIQETIDLSAYAGQKVQVRFEYLTDAAVTHAGMFLDDVAIPELSYRYDAESDGDWLARGFIRNANVLPQEWLLQLVKLQRGQTSVERLQLNPDNTGRWTLSLGSGEEAVLVVSGRAPVTTEPAGYWYALSLP
ncbi:MAG: immune inhibitor A [Thermoflexales bacterium]|nr:immune inhibitor A [Thermoflexales bacterium]